MDEEQEEQQLREGALDDLRCVPEEVAVHEDGVGAISPRGDHFRVLDERAVHPSPLSGGVRGERISGATAL